MVATAADDAGLAAGGLAADGLAAGGLADAKMDLIVNGVGRATPRAAALLAAATGLPIEAVVDAIYRAPGRLLAGVPATEARRILALLEPLGLELAVLPAGGEMGREAMAGGAMARGALHDVAIELTEPAAADEVAAALGQFLGVAADQALEMMLTPPCIVLGNVTLPTVRALAAALPQGAAELRDYEPDRARYALFANGLSAAQAAVLRPSLPPGGAIGEDGSALLLGLSRMEADALWRRLCAPERVRLVPEDLLRFAIVLHDAPADAAAALEALAGIPAQDAPLLLAAAPLTIECDLPLDGLELRLARYAEAGIGVTAELESFKPVVLEVLSASSAALAAAGLRGPAPCLTPPLPRPRARLLRHRLEAAGADVLEAAA